MADTLSYLRLAALLLDLLLLFLATLAFGYLVSGLLQFIFTGTTLVIFIFWRFLLLLASLVFLLRDAWGSPGKRVFGIQVITRKGVDPTHMQSILRNLFLLLPPLNLLELYRVFVLRCERLGDRLAGTEVVEI